MPYQQPALKEDAVPAQPAPYGPEVRIRIGGPAGFGIKAAGQTLARVFARSGYHTFDLTEYPSLIKGGHNTYHLRVSEEEIFSHVMPTDILLALDAQTIGLHLAELTQGAAVVFDPKDVSASQLDLAGREDLCLVPVPLTDIVQEVGGIKIMRNVVALGAVLGKLGFPLEGLLESLKSQFAHKAAEVTEQNVAAATRGYESARDTHCDFPHRLEPRTARPFVLADGNEACGLGALAGGVGFYAAYPMTPASSLLNFMAKHADDQGRGGQTHGGRDSSDQHGHWCGVSAAPARCAPRRAVASRSWSRRSASRASVNQRSWSGCSLGRVPQRDCPHGPSSRTYASRSMLPRASFLASSWHRATTRDMFDLTWKAFNLADQLQTPVIILGDTYLSDNRQTVPLFDTYDLGIDRGELIAEGKVRDYQRYELTDSGVSPRALPGVDGALQLVNSYEHDAHGWATEDAVTRNAQNAKRLKKHALAAQLVPPPREFGPHTADLSILLFGSTKMPVREAMKWLEADGVTVNMLQLVSVWPFPATRVAEFLERSKRSLVIEGNATGQLEGLVREHCLQSTRSPAPSHRWPALLA